MQSRKPVTGIDSVTGFLSLNLHEELTKLERKRAGLDTRPAFSRLYVNLIRFLMPLFMDAIEIDAR